MQYYIQPYLTPCGRKFHLRALVLAVGDLSVYLYHNIRVLIATERYEACNYDNPFIHLTNQSVNQKHSEYDETRQNLDLDQFFDRGSQEKVGKQIKSIVKCVFSRLAQDRKRFFTLKNCYELFGFDFMLDQTQRVWLLEANPDPSLSMYHNIKSADQVLGKNVFESLPNDTFDQIHSPNSIQTICAFGKILASNGNLKTSNGNCKK